MWDPQKPPSERLMIGVIAFLGIAALFLGTLQIQKGLKGHFQDQQASQKDVRNDLDIEQVNKLSQLQQKDTDKDGLNDFAELYNTRTSPYLRDSDSDGLDDKSEIDGGTDPNCPKGQDCGTPIIAVTNANRTTNTGATNGAGGSTNSVLGGNMTPDELRQVLISSGAPESSVTGLSDAQLIQLYNEVIAGQTPTTPTNTKPAANTNSKTSNANIDITKLTQADLEKLSAQDIRNLMVQFGVPTESISQIDDATLKSIFLQSLQEQQNSQQK